MASNVSQSEEVCTCPVCCDIFKDPVVLLCGHSFCRLCLQAWWRQSGQQTCPVCKELFPMRHQPPARNLALRDLSDTLRQDRSQRATSGATSGATQLCGVHSEKLKLFCEDDQQLVCVICRDAQKHKKHNCVPIDEAAEEHRTKLRVELMHLKSKLGSFQTQKLNGNKMASHLKLQAQQTEKTVREEFQKLYQFLRAEEAARVDAVRKEAALKSEAMNIWTVNLNAEISTLADKIKTLHRELKSEDFTFMLNFKSTSERSQCNLSEPLTPSQALIDEGKHVGNLLFTVWKKMKHKIKFTPVILDPNSSGAQLILSENLTRVSESEKAQQLPKNPERKGGFVVLGHGGFSSGKHSWDVEVSDVWATGVAATTKHVSPALIWGIYLYGIGGELCELLTDKAIRSTRDLLLTKIRVQLDYDQGTLTFFDLDRKRLIHVIKHTFTEPVFPYFHGTVKIVPAEVSVGIRQPK